MICYRCGRGNQPGVKFCTNCGSALEQQMTSPNAQPFSQSGVTQFQTSTQFGQQGSMTHQYQQTPMQHQYQQTPIRQQYQQTLMQPKKSSGKSVAKVLAIVFGILLLLGVSGGIAYTVLHTDSTIEDEKNNDTKNPNNNQNTNVAKRTMMMYVIGSNLEYDYDDDGNGYSKGLASMDIEEVLDADYSEDVNIVIQTGGTKEWQNSDIKGNAVQRFEVDKNGLKEIDNLGKICMTKESTLSDFIQFSKENYPAEEYILVLWDHGGGVPNGFGVDSLFPDETLTDVELGNALEEGGVHFDVVIFNACLMCSLEVYMAIDDYTDYVVAAESVVTGTSKNMIGSGFEYTKFVNQLNDMNNSILTCCETLMNNYMEFLEANNWYGTMSIMRMNRIEDIYEAYDNYISECYEELKQDGYNDLIQARAACGDFDGFDFVDINTLAYKYENEYSTDLQNAISNAIELTDSYGYSNGRGITAYFPYELCYLYDDGRKSLVDLGYSDSIIGFYDLLASKYLYYSGLTAYVGDWYVEQTGGQQASVQDSDEPSGETGEYLLETVQVGGVEVIDLTEDDWGIIVEPSIRKSVALTSGDYVYFIGEDDAYTCDYNDYLTLEIPGYWLTMNGSLPTSEVVYCLYDDNSYYCEFLVYAYVDDEPAMILVTMTDTIDNLSVIGYFPCDEEFSEYDEGYYFEGDESIQYAIQTYDSASDSMGYRYYTDTFTANEIEALYDVIDFSEYGEEVYVQYLFDDVYGNSYHTEFK